VKGWEVAIPSYKRAETLNAKTLTTLANGEVDPERITVWVADEEEKATYEATLNPEMYGEVRVSAPTLRGSRNAIWRNYEPGTYLMFCDDDIESIYRKRGEQGRAAVGDVEELFNWLLESLENSGLSLVGIYPVDNPYFMKHEWSTDLKYVIGALYGIRVEAGPHMDVTLEDKEDYERTILHYLAHGGVLRRNDVGMVTRYYKEPGGMQVTRTAERITASAHYLAEKYPTLVRVREAKSGHTELSFRPQRRPQA
jgi:hypothetical protein